MRRISYLVVCLTLAALSYGEELIITPMLSSRGPPGGGKQNKPADMLTIAEGAQQTLDFKFFDCEDNETTLRNLQLTMTSGIERNLQFPEFIDDVPCSDNNSQMASGTNATFTGQQIGFVVIEIKNSESNKHYLQYSIGVTRPPLQIKDQIFLYGAIVLVTLGTFSFGLKLELDKIKKYLKKPIAPCIGMACQYLLMPLIGYSIVSVMSDMHPALKFGIFASAAAPGGGFSNTWIFVLNGDLDLSIAMTFLSSCAALGFMPLWLYTIGKDILGDTEIVIPFKDLAQSLALLIAPLIIGVVIKRFLPKVTEKLLLAQKPLIAFLLLFALVTGIWANLYAFRMVLTDYRLALCAFLQQVAGGVLGFLIALACQQGKTLAITIGVETAIQNLKIVTIMLRTSLPQPWADISSAVPISMIVFAFPTFIILLIGRLIYTRFIKKEGDDDSEQSHKASVSSLELEEGVSNPAVVDDDEKETEKEKEEKSV